MGAARSRQRHPDQSGCAQVAERLGRAHPNPLGARQYRQCELLDHRRVDWLQLRRRRQHRHHQLHDPDYPVRPDQRHREHRAARWSTVGAGNLRPGRQRRWHQPRARQDDVVERDVADIRCEQRQRRQSSDLLGEHEQRVPAMAAGRPRLVGQRQQARAEGADRLGHANRDAVGRQQHGRCQLRHARGLDGLRVRRFGEHRHDHVRGHDHALSPVERHREHRVAGRADLRVRGVRPDHRRHHGTERSDRTCLHATGVGSDQADLECLHGQRRP